MKSQKGFSVVVLLLAIITMTLLASVAYFVYDSQQEPETQSPNQSAQYASPSKQEVKDPTAGWKTYKDPGGAYQFKHPAGWVFADSLSLCNPGTVLFGVDTNSTGKCGSDLAGQMSVGYQSGDLRDQYELKKSNYPDVTTEAVTVSGVTGKKQFGTFNPTDPPVFGEVGDKNLTYIFFKNNKTFIATYQIKKTNPYPDAQTDFELLITKTLELN